MTTLDWLLVVTVAGLLVSYAFLLAYAEELADEDNCAPSDPGVTWASVLEKGFLAEPHWVEVPPTGTAGTKR